MLKYPGTRALVVRKVARSLTGTTLATFRDKVAVEAIETRLVHFYGGSAAEPASFRYDNGSRIVVGGLDEPQRIMGSEVRSEEHTSELQSLMSNSYAVFCLKKKIHATTRLTKAQDHRRKH